MKMILKEGKFIKEEGKDKLHFEPGSTDTECLFAKSVDNVTHTFSAYEYGKLNDKEIYYLYSTLKGHVSKEEIISELDKILMGDDSNIFNVEDTTICMPLDVKINTVFWDVLNNIIIVYGKDNLKKLVFEIELSTIPEFMRFKTEEDKINFLEEGASPVYQKVKNV